MKDPEYRPVLSDAEYLAIEQMKRHRLHSRGSAAHGVAQKLYTLVRENSPRTCVEIGCLLGSSTVYLAKAAKENDVGKVFAFDLNTVRAAATIAASDLQDWVQFVDGPSEENIPKILHDAPSVGVAFIDGDHTCRGCVADFVALFPWLERGAYIVIDDIRPKECGWFGPRFLVKLLGWSRGHDGFAQFHIEEQSGLNRTGLAICRLEKLGRNPARNPIGWQRAELIIRRSRIARYLELAWFDCGKFRSGQREARSFAAFFRLLIRRLFRAVSHRLGAMFTS